MSSDSTAYELRFPEHFDDNEEENVQREILLGTTIAVGSRTFEVSFYSSLRLSQDILRLLEWAPFFVQKNIIALPVFDRAHMEAAVRELAAEAFAELA